MTEPDNKPDRPDDTTQTTEGDVNNSPAPGGGSGGQTVSDDEIDTDQTLNENMDQRRDWENELNSTAEDVRNLKENGAEVESNSIGSMIGQALGVGKDMKDAQDEIEARANRFRDLFATRKSYFEGNFGDREERVSIDGERVEEEYGNFRSEFDLALDEVLPMAWERGFLKTVKQNNSRYRAATGELDIQEEQAMQESGDLWMYAEGEAQDAKENAEEAIGEVLDEVNPEAQALELRDRKETYDNIKEVVDDAIETVQSADSEVSIDEMSGAIQEAADEYGLDIGDELGEDTVESVAELSRGDIEGVAEELGVEDEVVSSVTTDVTEFFDEEDVDPIEAARLVKTTVADAFARQAERYDTAVNVVDEVRGDLAQQLSSYETFESHAEDLTNIEGVGDTASDYLQEAGIDTVFDLANASQKRLDRMTDAAVTHGENASGIIDDARTYIETELAHELGLEDLKEQMEETVPTGEDVDIRYGVREQVESAYEASNTIKRHINSLLENTVPGSDEYIVEFEKDGETYSPSELAEDERAEVYGELGLNPADLDGLGFLEDTQDLDLQYE